MSDAPADLAVENLTKTFTTAGGDLSVLRNLNLTMQRGESVVVTGPRSLPSRIKSGEPKQPPQRCSNNTPKNSHSINSRNPRSFRSC